MKAENNSRQSTELLGIYFHFKAVEEIVPLRIKDDNDLLMLSEHLNYRCNNGGVTFVEKARS